MVKTTLDLDGELLKHARAEADRLGMPLDRLVQEALWARLLPNLPVVEGADLAAFGELDHEKIYDLMERR